MIDPDDSQPSSYARRFERRRRIFAIVIVVSLVVPLLVTLVDLAT